MKFLSRFVILVCLTGVALAEPTDPAPLRPYPVDVKGAAVGRWTMDFAAAKVAAKVRKLPMLLYFTGSDWCKYCKIFSETVLSQPDWLAYSSNRFVLVYLDFPKDEALVPPEYRARNNQLQEGMGIQGYPSFVVLSHDGTKVLSQFSLEREGRVWSFARQMSEALRRSPEAVDAFVAGMSVEKGAEYRGLIKELAEAEKALEAWLKTKPGKTEENNRKFADFRVRIERVGGLLDAAEHERTFAVMAGEGAVRGKSVLRRSEECARILGELDKARQELEDWLLARPENDSAQRDRFQALLKKQEELLARLAELK
jgi:thioredoxin-related protein